MTREQYNATYATRPKPEVEEHLCSLDCCSTCIDYRIRHKMPLPTLKKTVWPTDVRYITPSIIRANGYDRDK